jgi:hypothetical protein
MTRTTFWVLAPLLAMAQLAQAQVPGGAFTTTTVDGASGTGRYAAVATGTDGLPLIAYRGFPVTLTVARCEDPACSRATRTAVPTFPIGTLLDISIAIGADGLPLISYRTGFALEVVHCNDTTCTSATTMSLPAFGLGTALTIGADGLGLVAYHDDTFGLKVAHCKDTACTAATTAVVDALGGQWHSVAIGRDGLPLISYDSSSARGVRVAHCDDLACSSSSIATIDDSAGRDTSMVTGLDGFALVSYSAEGALRVFHCSNATCTSGTRTTLDHAGIQTSVTLGADGRAIVSYLSPDFLLKVARCKDPACAGADTAVIGPGGFPVSKTSITIGGDGAPFVAYACCGSGSNDHLNAAHQAPRGDFNADGRQDLVWRRDGSGENLLWLMNGVSLTSSVLTDPSTVADPSWGIVGTGDFNADARSDLLWRHAGSGENVVWFLNGVDLVGGEFTTPPSLADTRWQMAGTGDFDRDGRPDILWRHATSGENVLWYMNGTVLASGTFLTPSSLPDNAWKVGGTGDFTRDGWPDILWHHQGSGQLVVWSMNGAVLTSGTFTDPPALPDVSWSVAAVGDYNVDGRPDIVWRNQGSGQTVVWLMNGATLVSGTFTNPGTFPDTNWRLVGPR